MGERGKGYDLKNAHREGGAKVRNWGRRKVVIDMMID